MLAAACGGAAPKQISDPASGGDGTRADGHIADPIPATAGPACATVAERVVQVALAEQPGSQPQAIEIVRKRCTEDRWSDAARNCLATVETDGELQGCREHLSEPQQKAVEQDMTAALGPVSESRSPDPVPDRTSKPKSKSKRSPIRRTGADPCEGGE
jgi:hypothetical protein